MLGGDTRSIDRGYFVRMGGEAPPEAPGWSNDARDGWSSEHRHRRRRPIPWGRWFLIAAVLAGLGWAARSPGGISARLAGLDSSIRGTVSNLTQSRELEQATKMFNGWFAEKGQYPRYTQSQLEQMPDASWGVGMEVSWCTPRDVVLTSLTASGTVSRLLIDGKKVGDVPGRVACPVDLVNPVPWQG